ncbi:MAG: ComEC/Rec2 family competence protein [Planctomycetota bacterium]|nr:ComEC/Rec2 family competence protein [Planctomycetota bacterium]
MLYIGGGAVIGSLIGIHLNWLPLLVFITGVGCISILAFRLRNVRILLVTVSSALFAVNAHLRLPTLDRTLAEAGRKFSTHKINFEGRVERILFHGRRTYGESDTEVHKIVMSIMRYECEGREHKTSIRALVRLSGIGGLECGDVLRFRARIREVERNSTLWYQGIVAVLTAAEKDFIERRDGGFSLLSIRASLERHLKTLFSDDKKGEDAANFAKAILIGERSAISSDLTEQFRNTGLSHILAISGTHLMFLALFVGTAAQKLLAKRRISLTIVICASVLYFFIGGMSPSLFRALVVALVYLFGILLGRKGDGFNTTGTALAVVLLTRPLDVMSLSFQLSFITFAGIVALYPLFRKTYLDRKYLLFELKGYHLQSLPLKERFFTFLWRTVFIALVAYLCAQPLTGYYFRILPYGSPLANILALPLFYLTLAIGILILALLPLSLFLAKLLAHIFSIFFAAACKLTEMVDSLGLHTFIPNRWIPEISLFSVFFFYGIIALAAARLREAFQFLTARHFIVLTLAALSFWILGGKISGRGILQNSITFLPVGQGMAVLVKTDEGIFLYDCGSARYGDSTGEFVARELLRRGVYRIDAVFLSHPDNDHTNGLLGLLKRISVRKVFVSEHFERDADGEKLLKNLKGCKIAVGVVKVPSKIGSRIKVVAPVTDELFGRKILKNNNLSLGIVVELGEAVNVFLTGDMENEGIGAMIVSGWVPRAEVLQLPHHGANQPLLDEFTEVIGAKKFIVSGLARELPLRVEKKEILETDVYGAIMVLSDGRIITEREMSDER